MALTRVATSSRETKSAVIIAVDGKTLELSQAQTADTTAEQIKVLLESAASLSNVQLPTVTMHVNRDGSIAMATGKLPKDFVWPEDDTRFDSEREA